MTHKEFNQMVSAICQEIYRTTATDPLDYGIGRARFEEWKLRRLILLAEQAVPSRIGKQKAAHWRKQWQRVHRIRTRLEERKIAARILTVARNQTQPPDSWPLMASQPLECWRPSGPG